MQQVLFWRVISFNKPAGPWRTLREGAQRDAADLGLGSYDEYGKFWKTVPGDIQLLTIDLKTVRDALERTLSADLVVASRSQLKRPRRLKTIEAVPPSERAPRSRTVRRR
jgi:hypothetical protein